MSLEHAPGRRMLRAREVVDRTGLSRSTIWRRIRAGTFPPATQLGENSIGWPETVIDEWLASRPQRSYGAETAYQPSEAA